VGEIELLIALILAFRSTATDVSVSHARIPLNLPLARQRKPQITRYFTT
jgi:hypothetical protein